MERDTILDNVKVDIIIGVTKNYLWKFGIQNAISYMPGYSVIGEYDKGMDILYICRMSAPRLLILDQELMDISTIDFQVKLTSENINVPILVIGDPQTNGDEIVKLFQNGIKGYIHYNSTKEQLIDAISHVSNHMEWCSPSFGPRLIYSKSSAMKNSNNHKKITNREQEILSLMVKGHNNTEISDLLCLSINTVQNHICNIYAKFGVRERIKAVNFAKQEGLIDL